MKKRTERISTYISEEANRMLRLKLVNGKIKNINEILEILILNFIDFIGEDGEILDTKTEYKTDVEHIENTIINKSTIDTEEQEYQKLFENSLDNLMFRGKK